MMEDFLYELARMKYMQYCDIFKCKPSAFTEEECYERIKRVSKYMTLLDIINLLPLEQSLKLQEIERKYFGDAPYVVHLN